MTEAAPLVQLSGRKWEVRFLVFTAVWLALAMLGASDTSGRHGYNLGFLFLILFMYTLPFTALPLAVGAIVKLSSLLPLRGQPASNRWRQLAWIALAVMYGWFYFAGLERIAG